jgi:opacity protein-like surface antigen
MEKIPLHRFISGAAVATLLAAFHLLHAAPASGQTPDSSRVVALIGVGAGAIRVDIPHPEKPGESFGSRPRVNFDLGYEISSHWGVDAELGVSFLGESDSLNAILELEGRDPGAAYTLVDFSVGLRGRLPLGSGRWAPFARAGIGGATFSLSWPDGGRRDNDLSWSLGGGLEFAPARMVLFRLEARWLAHRFAETIRNHAVIEFSVLYALLRSRMIP